MTPEEHKAALRAELERIELEDYITALETEWTVVNHKTLKAIIREVREQRAAREAAERERDTLRAQLAKESIVKLARRNAKNALQGETTNAD